MKVLHREHALHHARPEPDEVELEDRAPRNYVDVIKRAGKEMLNHNMLMFASALAYSAFFAIPSVLLVVVGLFTLVAGPRTITSLMQSFGHVMPAQATQLLGGSLHRLENRPTTTVVVTVVGIILAVWSTTGAMTGYMTALNLAYDCHDTRSFLQKRRVALTMAACVAFAFLLVATLLMFGPQLEKLIASTVGSPTLVAYLWWALQWPILVFGLLAAFTAMLYLGPDLASAHRHWRLITPNSSSSSCTSLASCSL